jgi:hypothetical protein
VDPTGFIIPEEWEESVFECATQTQEEEEQQTIAGPITISKDHPMSERVLAHGSNMCSGR